MTTQCGDSTESCMTLDLIELRQTLHDIPKHERDIRIRRFLHATNRKDDWSALLMGMAIDIDVERLRSFGVALSESARKFILATADPNNIGKDANSMCQVLGLNLEDILQESVTQPYKDFVMEIRQENIADLWFRMQQSFIRAFMRMAENEPALAMDYMYKYAQSNVLPALMTEARLLGSGTDDGAIDAQYVLKTEDVEGSE